MSIKTDRVPFPDRLSTLSMFGGECVISPAAVSELIMGVPTVVSSVVVVVVVVADPGRLVVVVDFAADLPLPLPRSSPYLEEEDEEDFNSLDTASNMGRACTILLLDVISVTMEDLEDAQYPSGRNPFIGEYPDVKDALEFSLELNSNNAITA